MRGQPSAADQSTIRYCAERDVAIHPAQLERWRGGLRPLVPPNVRIPGVAGTQPAEGAHELVLWLGQHSRPGSRPYDLALLAFAEGHVVPSPTVRSAFRRAVERVCLPSESELDPPTGDLEDWAADVATDALARGLDFTIVPARISSIDARLTTAGANWSPAEVARLDTGSPHEDPMTRSDFAVAAVTSMLAGPQAVPGADLGAMARMLLPDGAANPFASMVEHGGETPDADGRVIDETGALTILPEGDMRPFLVKLVDNTSDDRLRLAWTSAAEVRVWALELCDATERELDQRAPGPAINEWMLGAFHLLPRLILAGVLRDHRWTPTDHAFKAVELLMLTEMIAMIRQHVPDGDFAVLGQFLPGCVHELAGIVAVDPL